MSFNETYEQPYCLGQSNMPFILRCFARMQKDREASKRAVTTALRSDYVSQFLEQSTPHKRET